MGTTDNSLSYDEVKAFLARMQDLVPDEWWCEVCCDEPVGAGGCSACIKGIRPDIVDAIYQQGVAAGREDGLRKGFVAAGYYIAAEVDGWVLVRPLGRDGQFLYDVRCSPQRDACDAPALELLRKAGEHE